VADAAAAKAGRLRYRHRQGAQCARFRRARLCGRRPRLAATRRDRSAVFPAVLHLSAPRAAADAGKLPLNRAARAANEWYAIAKIAGLKLCQAYRRQHGCDFVSVMPTNLYGPNDNFDLLSSHVLPALLAKIDAAVREGRDQVEIWGSGRPRREFLHVDDLVDAVVFLMKTWSDEAPINIGTGTDIPISELAKLIAGIVGFEGRFIFDPSKPDGTPRKLLDVSKLTALGWRPRIDLETGIRATYQWYRTSGATPSWAGSDSNQSSR
jgi:GDP-L-fucose synthase